MLRVGTMYTAVIRLHNLASPLLLAAGALFFAVALSSSWLWQEPAQLDVAYQKMEVDLKQKANARRQNAVVHFDLDADFTNSWNWNVKDIYVSVVLSYLSAPRGQQQAEASGSKVANSMVIWDTILSSKESAVMKLRDTPSKYPVRHLDGLLPQGNMSLRVEYSTFPHVGYLYRGSGPLDTFVWTR